MKTFKTLKEWLESQGNPKHTVTACEDGFKIVVIEDNKPPKSGIICYRFKEEEYYGYKTFWIGSGWCVHSDQLQAIADWLDGESEFEDDDDDEEYASSVTESKAGM